MDTDQCLNSRQIKKYILYIPSAFSDLQNLALCQPVCIFAYVPSFVQVGCLTLNQHGFNTQGFGYYYALQLWPCYTELQL